MKKREVKYEDVDCSEIKIVAICVFYIQLKLYSWSYNLLK